MSKVPTETSMQNVFQVKDDSLYFKDRVYIPQKTDLRTTILLEYHSSPVAGHIGLQPTLTRISSSFLWPGIYKDT